MAAKDIFQSINEMDSAGIQKIVDRLEFRGNDPSFIQMRDAYLAHLQLEPNARVLEIGCGTGVVLRALAQREGFGGTLVGSDFSDVLIGVARRLAAEDNVGDRIDFRVGDSHGLEDPDDHYDAVIAHTLISHVVDPAAVISQAARVARPGGKIVFFDGDYASLVFGAGDAKTNGEMVDGILAAIVANPHVMRQLPALLQRAGLAIDGFLPHVLAEAGDASFFSSMAESYVPIAVKAGIIADDKAANWLAGQRAATERANFFGSCNFYSFIARKPG